MFAFAYSAYCFLILGWILPHWREVGQREIERERGTGRMREGEGGRRRVREGGREA